MPTPSFTDYLEAKQTVDDRALNARVWQQMVEKVRQIPPPRRILEIGAGTGSMIERLLAHDVLAQTHFTAVDSNPNLLNTSLNKLTSWGQALLLWDVNIEHVVADAHDFVANPANKGQWDLVIANAFLDLVDVSAFLPQLLSLLKPNALFYFTINFDGDTIFQPPLALDDEIMRLYHQTMDDRITDGRPAGDSRAGRHLFQHLPEAGAKILDAGSSDWVVFPQDGGYVGDEATFLHFIINTIGGAVGELGVLDAGELAAWVAERHGMVNAGILTYIAHQLDFLGRKVG
jgi:2-polyprenyl-3-methyl-5-hydroxy-6-metoxy-1,4-benzoquinol methylase